MRMLGEHRSQHAQNADASFVQGAEAHLLSGGDYFERRFQCAKVPALVAPRIFIAGGKIAAAELVQVA